MSRLAVVLPALVLAGCAAAPEPGPLFNDEAAADIACMSHQTDRPGARYVDASMRRSDETLRRLRYYTAHARKSYCDGQPPSETDKAWAGLYVDLGADRANVASLLD